ncbi:rhomboid family intramembrane serine protease [Coralloluteibacterium thermophilus]|uniref:Rhomboid family intramembrane serine protease n=1 Tax=Coralloluteibacterium thermophilum TaxID=2707049 RepID=A0ABV9NJP2_9GAMM
MVTLGIVAVTCVVTILAWQRPGLVDRLILWPPAVRKGQYDRLVTSGFIHADVAHLAFNMITLFFFGRVMESVLAQLGVGALGYLLFYLSALLVSVLPSYIKHRDDPNYRCLGASGAVSAVLFAFVLVSPWSLIFVFFIPAPAILYAVFYVGYSIWMDRRGGDNVNHGAHLAGAAYGVLFLVLLHPPIVQRFFTELANPAFLR